ncbi:GNAT family N-acetyltransferase [Sphingobacterium sp. LRF_L2]|uniref:GNAT family N-acetyltransferase n=1 Tax=Sphingobacterium sp. LRF_L2 TaxID=3369421 RepID=UPI003F5DC552
MTQKNIDNISSLWLTVANMCGGYKQTSDFHVLGIDYSEWPNRIWTTEQLQPDSLTYVKKIMQQSPVELTLSTWNQLTYEAENEADSLGLVLKSTQIGMSMPLSDYQTIPVGNIHLDPVDHIEKSILWSTVFKQCFGYLIPSVVIEKIKTRVSFFLLKNDRLQTVGCVATFTKDNQIGIHSLGILDQFRKQGFAERTMHYLLRDAKQKGLLSAHLQSSMLGLGIYKKIGFNELFKMCNYKLKT